MSTPDSSGVSGGSSDKSGPQITVQKSVAIPLAASVVQATAQQAATATFRTIAAGGQSSQVRVVMPPVTLMPQAMIKQIESGTGGVRTQITAIPAAAASRTMSQTSITVTRPVTPTTYIPRPAGVTTTNIQAQRLATPIRTPTPPTAVTGLSAATVSGNFVRNATVAAATVTRNPSSSPATVSTTISPATATWMATGAGQVQLIRAINHQPRQRIIAQNISSSTAGTSVVSVAQATNINNSGQNQQQQQQSQTANIQTVQTSQQPQQQTFVATLATVMPPRQPTATLVYSNVSSAQPQQYSATSTPTQRFTVAASLGGNQRQVRPIQLNTRTFSTTKLGVGGMNTTSISIRAPNIPVLTPTINTAGGATGTLQARTVGTTSNVNLSTSSLSTTRIIQLQQQQPGNSTQQIIGSTGRITSNLMLQPIIMNTAGGNKIGIRPPTTIATKVQPSLTITQLGLGKISTAQQSTGTAALTATNIQNASIAPSSSANTSSVVVSGSTAANIAQQSSQQQTTNISQQQQQPTAISVNVSNTQQPITQIVSINQNIGSSGSNAAAGQMITTQNVPASATVVPLTITSRSNNVLTGTITSMKAGATVSSALTMPPIAKVIPQQQQTQSQQQSTQNQQHHHSSQGTQIQSTNQQQGGQQQVTEIITSSHQPQQSSHHQPTSVFIHTRPPSSGSAGTATVIPSSGTFLPGGTFYYESVPASSVTVSTGVISLTTTTVSTTSNSLSVASSSNLSSNATGIVTSIPYNPPSAVAAAGGTFTVVPPNSRATIGQIQIPVSSSAASGGSSGQQTANVSHVQAVPIRFAPQHLAAEHSVTVTQTPQQQTQSQQSQQQQALSHGASPSQQQQQHQHHQIITMTQQQPPQSSQQPPSQQQQPSTHIQQTHMLIPIQTSIKIPAAAAAVTPSPPRATSTTHSTAASVGTTTTAFFRKRDNEGSPIRATKNLTPAILSMGANSTVTTNNINSQLISSLTNQHNTSGGGMGILAERNKENSLNERPDSPHSRPSSSGSTTVSANSSPGVDQQEEMNSLAPMNIRSESHFNPINDMYPNHQNAVPSSLSISQQMINISSNTNGSIEGTPRKKLRRQNNEVQHQQQMLSQNQPIIIHPQHHQLSHQLPQQQQQQQPQFNNQQQQIVTNQVTQMNVMNNTAAATTANVISTSSITINNSTSNNHDITKPNNTAVNNKENTKPTEYIIKKPRTCSLLDGYHQNWKAANNHFQRYSDVKPREERRPTVMDLANQANVVQKINGWKVHHLNAQMEDLCEIEMQMYDKLESMLKQLESHEQSQDLNRVNELIKGNMQRSKIIVDGVTEARTQIMKIFDHKTHVSDIIQRCASKRNFKKREKT